MKSKFTLHETPHVLMVSTYASIVPILGVGRPLYYVLPTSAKYVHGQTQSHGMRVAISDSWGTEVGFGPAIVGVGMRHVAGAGAARGNADIGNGNTWVTTGN